MLPLPVAAGRGYLAREVVQNVKIVVVSGTLLATRKHRQAGSDIDLRRADLIRPYCRAFTCAMNPSTDMRVGNCAALNVGWIGRGMTS